MIFQFDFLAPLYDRMVGFFLGQPDAEKWRELLNLPTGGRLLDAGGGTGRVSAPLRSLVGQPVVVDISSGMIRQAREKGDLELVRADAAQLPFPDACFERIIVVDSLHHFSQQRQVVQELARVLSHDGLLVIEEFDIRRLPVKGIALVEKLALMGSRFLRPEKIQEQLQEAGLTAEILKGEKSTIFIVARKSPPWRSMGEEDPKHPT